MKILGKCIYNKSRNSSAYKGEVPAEGIMVDCLENVRPDRIIAQKDFLVKGKLCVFFTNDDRFNGYHETFMNVLKNRYNYKYTYHVNNTFFKEFYMYYDLKKIKVI